MTFRIIVNSIKRLNLNNQSKMNKKKKFAKIAQDIKDIKIQGARNVAKQALYAYSLIPTKQSKKILMSLRPTEPMLFNVLKKVEIQSYQEILNHFEDAQQKINQEVVKIIKSQDIIFTHCHSTNVVNALIYAKKQGKNFEVYLTETRPLFQGRKTATELRKAGIKTTMFVDSALGIALMGSQGVKKADKIFLGADALLNAGVINKVGSGLISKVAKLEKTPLYIVADSWKYTPDKIKLEQRNLKEVWDDAPAKVKIKNPAFEFVPRENIKNIVSELGALTYSNFLKKVKKA